MSGFDLLLDAASLSAELSMVGQLNGMRQQGAAQAAAQQILAALRNEIFKYGETSKNILAVEVQDVKVAAGAMRLLEQRLRESGISTDLFFELGDKEYVSNAFRTIETNASRLTNSLSPDEKDEVENLVNKASHLNDYDYYLNNYTVFNEYRNALPKSKGPGQGMGIFGCLLAIATALCGGVTLLTWIGGYSSGGDPFEALVFLSGGLCIGTIFLAGLALAFSGFRGASAKQVVERVNKQLSVDLMNRLDNEFHGDLQKVQSLRDEAQGMASQFFGGSQFLMK